ncbi:MAG TPA: TolC family protein [Gemmatimonadales bacterium]
MAFRINCLRLLPWAALCLVATVSPLAAQTATAPTTLTLAGALARGRSSGIQAALARLSAQGAVLHGQELGAAKLPQVTSAVTVERQTVNLHEFGISIPGFPPVTDPFTLFRARIGASQTIFDPALSERLRAARDTAVAAGLDAQQAGELGAAAAGAAWLRVASAQETLNARTDDSVTAFALLDIANSQVDAGTSPRIDRTRSETQAAAVRTQIAVARNQLARARLDLARAVDLPAAVPVQIDSTAAFVSDSMPSDLEAAIALARSKRLDLAAELQRQAVLQRGLQAIRNEFIPTVGASGYAQTSGTDLSDDMRGTWNIGVALSWSIFDGYRRKRREDEQRVRLDAEGLRLHDLEAQIDVEVREAALDVASSHDQVVLAGDRVRLAEEELSEARERFQAGVAGSVETTNAQAELSAARDVLIQARLSAGAAQVSAARALGLLDQVH